MADTARNDANRSLADRAPGELIAIGRAMYENEILPQIPHVKKGMMVVMDMASGDYEIDRRAADARTRLERRRPNVVMHTERVGYPTPVSAVSMRGKSGARTQSVIQ